MTRESYIGNQMHSVKIINYSVLAVNIVIMMRIFATYNKATRGGDLEPFISTLKDSDSICSA